uniref:Uncharacterized protein n=1 Tax=viral metagenome TaxID=1070528 RepID=A0A6C0LGD5_9ZZZZ
MELQIQLEENHIKMENIQFQKMVFLFNALNEGWSIQKRKDSYIFTKKHEGKKEIFLDSYLMSFLKNNFDSTKLLLS